MLNRILIGLGVLLALVVGFAPDLIPANITMLVLVLGGIVYAAIAVDAEDSNTYLIVTIAVGAAAAADALSNIPAIGAQLDGAMDAIGTSLNGGVATILAMRIVNRLKG